MSSTLNYDALSSFVEVDGVDAEFYSITESEFDGNYENQDTINAIFKYILSFFEYFENLKLQNTCF